MPGSPLTPNELFYVRNHLPVPLVKGAASPDASPGDLDLSETVNDDWKIQVQGLDPEKPPLELTVRDLKTRFEKVVVPATLQCSGNRRTELSREVKPVQGLEWDSGAISTAAWGGARLSDVLKAAGVASQEEALSRGRKHVCFDGGDVDGAGGSDGPRLQGVQQYRARAHDGAAERRGGGVAEERDGHSSKGSRSRVFPFEDGGLMGSLCLSTPAPAPLRAWL